MSQRLITSISAPTSEGELYEVDMRLRPSGSKGPVAVSLTAFEAYQAGAAWTWEKLALTRARIVAGPAHLTSRLKASIRTALCAPRDPETTRTDVLAMRSLMLREHNPATCWDIKRVRGGLVEAEFMAQYLQLLHGPRNPDLFHTNTFKALAAMRDAGHLPLAEADALLRACQLYHRLTQIIRLCLVTNYEPAEALPGLNRAVALAAGTADVRGAEALLQDSQTEVQTIFDRHIGNPEK